MKMTLYQTYHNNLFKTKTSNYIRPKNKIERFPYPKNNNIIIERIKDNNKSVSPSKKTKVELYRNISELDKKSEIISNRKKRMSFNNTQRSFNDLSFSSERRSFYMDSIEKNKEILEINKNKEKKK